MLERVMPVPWDAIPWQPSIHFGLFVHRVEGSIRSVRARARSSQGGEAQGKHALTLRLANAAGLPESSRSISSSVASRAARDAGELPPGHRGEGAFSLA